MQETDTTPVGLTTGVYTPTSTSSVPGTGTSSGSTTTSTGGSQVLYGQCGGATWTGPTTCQAPAVCTYNNAYYSQCLPP
jgi:hypothetical protein